MFLRNLKINSKMWTDEQINKIANKCADGIEFGYDFGKYSRLKKFQYAIIIDEKKNMEGKFKYFYLRKKFCLFNVFPRSIIYSKKKNQKRKFCGQNFKTQNRRTFISIMEKRKNFLYITFSA